VFTLAQRSMLLFSVLPPRRTHKKIYSIISDHYPRPKRIGQSLDQPDLQGDSCTPESCFYTSRPAVLAFGF
jgi:hypothetical protein